jgi:hypothetical protein
MIKKIYWIDNLLVELDMDVDVSIDTSLRYHLSIHLIGDDWIENR